MPDQAEQTDRPARPFRVAGATCVIAALAWATWPTLVDLVGRWSREPDYSHGFLVPLFSGYLLWARRARLAGSPLEPSWWGIPLLAAGLFLHLAGTYYFLPPVTGLAIVPCVAGAFTLLGGRRGLAWSWPAAAFLAFMVPLPYQVQDALALPLQRFAARASAFCLQTLGFAAFTEGVVIRMGTIRIGVVEACNGLSMMVLFFALATAVAIVVRRSWVERLIVVASAVPVAVASNVVRITVTGILYKTVGGEIADRVFHDLAGWLMMPLALVLLWLELRLLSWVFVPAGPQAGEADEKVKPLQALIRSTARRTGSVKPLAGTASRPSGPQTANSKPT